jgi:hypothetical protein
MATSTPLPESFKDDPTLDSFRDVESLGVSYMTMKNMLGARVPYEEAARLREINGELLEALEAMVDWDGEHWRLTSSHPNDRDYQDDWKDLMQFAKAIIAKARGEKNNGY